MAADRTDELLWSRMDVPTSSPGQHFGNGTFLEAEFTHDKELTSQTPCSRNTLGVADVWHQSAGHISEILSQLWARHPKAHRHLRAPLHGQINLSSSQSRALPDLPLMALGTGSRRQKPLQNAHRSGTLLTLWDQPYHQHYPTLLEEDMGKHINIW